MKFISLFAGIGGFDLGLERAGMECVAQVEKDPFCLKVLQKHWAHVPKFKDVFDVGKHNLPAADLICGGFPCQPHSRAGKQQGKADDRNLWGEYRRIIDELRPAWVIGENVIGIKDTILDEVLSDLESRNYKTVPFIIPSCAFNAPHIRERVFILGWHVPNSEGWRRRFFNAENVWKEYLQSDTFTNSGEILALGNGNPWEVEPAVGRVVDGVPDRVDRIRALGNAVVPQVVEFLGIHILKAQTWLTPLALDGGDSAALQALSTPEVLSTLQGESNPAHRK